MSYRDDRDALKGRVNSLEQDLDAARKELEEARHLPPPTAPQQRITGGFVVGASVGQARR